MSEDKWKEEMRTIVREELEKLKIPEAPHSSTPEKEEHPTHTLESLLSCPDCYPKIKKAVLEKEILERKNNPLECENCGTRVREEEPECPTCGGTEARNR